MGSPSTITPVGPRARPLGKSLAAGSAIWALLLLTGLLASARWSARPGAAGAAPAAWPQASALRRDDRWALVLFLHPHCPCSVATVRELERALTHLRDRVTTQVAFCAPKGATAGWTDSKLRRAVEAIPGIDVATDHDGREALRFGVGTSGTAVLFDAGGERRFQGGITSGRGHEGSNAGIEAVLGLVLQGASRTSSTPVFGCPLFDEEPSPVTPAETPAR